MNDRIPRPTTKVIAAALRHRVLTLVPSDIGWERSGTSTFFGGVVEFAHDARVHTLVVLQEGSVSLYDSDGHGSLGCGSHATVRSAARKMLEGMEALIPISIEAHDWDAPKPGELRCHLLMADGRRLLEGTLTSLEHSKTPLKQLYFAAQGLIALIDRVHAGQSLSDEIELAYSAMTAEENERCWSVGNVAHRLRI